MSDKQKTSKKSTSVRKAVEAKAGKRKLRFQRPPWPTRTPAELEARALRRGRLDGAFGRYCPTEVYNFLILGTNGQERVVRSPKELAAVGEFISKNNAAIEEAA